MRSDLRNTPRNTFPCPSLRPATTARNVLRRSLRRAGGRDSYRADPWRVLPPRDHRTAAFGSAQKKRHFLSPGGTPMKTSKLDEMLETLGRDGTVKAVSELVRKATTPRQALRYIRWLAELKGWMKPRRRTKQRRVDASPNPRSAARRRRSGSHGGATLKDRGQCTRPSRREDPAKNKREEFSSSFSNRLAGGASPRRRMWWRIAKPLKTPAIATSGI